MADIRGSYGAAGVTRAFGPVVANDRVSLAIRPGSVHAIVGENGAGKSTLIRIMAGLDQPDSGSVIVGGAPTKVRGPGHGLALGIGVVQQELALIPQLSLLDNLILGAEPRSGPFIDLIAARARAAELASRVGVEIDWDRPAAESPVGVQQQVEILRLLSRGADLLILDEPTAALAPAQVTDLLRLLRDLRERGHTVLFISHKLDEVLAVADEITVMRGGRIVATSPSSTVDKDRLAELIVGEPVAVSAYQPGPPPGRPVLEISGLAADDDRGTRRLVDLSLSVMAGEIVGVAGVAGNGQDELVECVVGLRASRSGSVVVHGRDVSGSAVAARRDAGLAYISADRKREGLALQATLAENAIGGFHRRPLSRRGWLSVKRVADFVRVVLDKYSVRHDSTTAPARTLSGGNQQRLVVGRELTHAPVVLVAAQPTRGVDVKGIGHIHEQLRSLRDRGAGVLLVSEELDELRALADRVVVLYRGEVIGELPSQPTRQRLGALMLGRSEVVA